MELETRRLLLRPLRDEDAPAMAHALNNINVSRNLARVAFPYGLADAQAFIALQRSFDQRSKICAITFKCAPDELIGVTTYEVDAKGACEFGYWLRECCWHMGVMSEAAVALVQHAFATALLEALQSGYHTDNPNSGRILRKLGFVETHEELNFSLAQGKEVPVMKMNLPSARWLEQQKGRAT